MNPVFLTTQWSLVFQAGDATSTVADAALAELCNSYWYPLYAYIRRKGYDPHEAQDLTQEFFLRLLSKNYFAGLDPSKGKFRSFLLACLENFLAKEWNRAHRQKRGGGMVLASFEQENAEGRYQLEPVEQSSPEKIYLRRWALTILERAMQRLKSECMESGKGQLFQDLQGALSGDKNTISYAEVAQRCDMTEGAVQVAVHRLRQRFAELVRDEIRQTVTTAEEVEEELAHLFEALRS